MPLKVNRIPGELPRFWKRETIFFANLYSLFFGNREQAQVLEREVRGVSTYGGRVVPILNLIYPGGRNLIFLEATPNPALLEYFTRTLALSLPQQELLPTDRYVFYKERMEKRTMEGVEEFLHKIRDHKAPWLDGYVTDDTLVSLADHSEKKTVSTFDGSKKGNNKYLLHYYLEKKGLPVFSTYSASSREEVEKALGQLRKMGFHKAILKSQIGASGCGMMFMETGEEGGDREVPSYLFFEGPCLVQGWLDESLEGLCRTGSPSVQMFLNEEEVNLFDITEQFLSEGSVHEGNLSPPPYLAHRPDIKEELLSQASVAGSWLHEQGYRGTASVDFLIVRMAGETVVYICEINARITGATYPALLARRFLPGGAWLMKNVLFKKRVEGKAVLDQYRKIGLIFTPEKEEGILPFNFNEDQQRGVYKGQFLFLAADIDRCNKLLMEMYNRSPFVYRFARD